MHFDDSSDYIVALIRENHACAREVTMVRRFQLFGFGNVLRGEQPAATKVLLAERERLAGENFLDTARCGVGTVGDYHPLPFNGAREELRPPSAQGSWWACIARASLAANHRTTEMNSVVKAQVRGRICERMYQVDAEREGKNSQPRFSLADRVDGGTKSIAVRAC
ncbi:MAG: hypothetical protein ACTSX8_06075 [Alphaproteobacteria bacterium]